MKVSLALAQFYSNTRPDQQPIDDVVKKIGAQLGAVEETVDLGPRYKGVLIVKVVECRKHENSDHLNVCKVDDGGRAENVARDENGLVQVVCGAPNVRAGLMTIWLAPGVAVPESIIVGEPFVLEARELRDEMSNGMLASARELGISDDHNGIVEVDDENAQPGQLFADVYHLNDHIIDIENKMFTHRPDCFGLLGVYRELAGIQGQKFEAKEWYTKGNVYPLNVEAEQLPLSVRNELPELTPRFMAVALSDIEVKPSPLWLQIHLMRGDMRPVNNVVDITNFVMYLTGQPLHAYDYDKVAVLNNGNAELTVRYPHEGEKIKLLNGKEIEPRTEAIMIAAGEHLLGVAGVMGGADTEVSNETKRIILECATFDMYSIRRTAMANGLFTDAVTRFNKGQSPLQNQRVIAKAVHEFQVLANGKVASEVVDDNHLSEEVMSRDALFAPVVVTTEFINARLGLKLSAEEMQTLLENVEFKVSVEDQTLTITAPFWRTDIEIAEDIVEEVGRLYGFDRLPLELPTRTLTPPAKNRLLELKSAIRTSLSEAGANEVLTYSFVHGDLLDKAGQDKSKAFQLSNALSPDLQYYRLSLLPSLLGQVHANVKAGHDEFALFEMNKVHDKTAIDEDGLPLEFDNLALVYAAQKPSAEGAPYFQARKFLERVAASLGHAVKFRPINNHAASTDAPFELSRSALIYFADDESQAGFGIVGEFSTSVRKKLKLPEHAAGFELGIGAFLGDKPFERYTALPKFPKVEQDICLKVPSGVSYQDLYDFAFEQLAQTHLPKSMHSLTPVDIYQREDDQAHKQITLRFSVASYEKTLRDEEVTRILDDLAVAAHEKFQAERI
jgi:phenylalanyl-tRNA synthetase beta chain